MNTAEAAYIPEPHLKEMLAASGDAMPEEELSRLLRILRDFRADGVTEEAALKIFECFPAPVGRVVSAYWKFTA